MKLTVILNADATGLIGTVRVSEAELRKLGATLDRTEVSGGKAGRGLRETGQGADSAAGGARRLSTTLNQLKGTLATLGIAKMVTEVIHAGRAMDRYNVSLAAAMGSQEQGGREMAFLRSEAQRLGLYLPSLIQGYTGLAAATRGTNLEGEQTRLIFSAVAEAGRAMNLTQDQIAGTMNALQQIAGKGTVSMEELRQQLGDRLPGAMQIAAKSMNMPVAALVKMVSEGKLASDVFLPKFAAELSKASAAGVEFAKNSPEAIFMRMKTSLFELGAAISGAGLLGLLADVAASVGDIADELATRWPRMIEIWRDALAAAFSDTAEIINVNLEALVGATSDATGSLMGRIAEEFMILPVSLGTVITVIIGEFDKLLISASEMFEKLWLGGKDAWLAIEMALIPVAGNIKLVFARMVDEILGRLASMIASAANVAEKLGADETAAKLNQLSGSLKGVAVAEELVRQQIEQATGAVQAQRDQVAQQAREAEQRANQQRAIANDAIQASLDEREAALAKLRATKDAADATAAAGKATAAAAAQTEEQRKAQEKLTAATRQWENLLGRVAGALDPVSKAQEKHNQFVRDATAQAEKLIKLGGDELSIREQLAAAIHQSATNRDAEVDSLRRQQQAYMDVLADLDAEAALIAMNDEAREQHIASMRAEEAMRRAIAVAQQAGAELEEEEIERLVRMAGARAAMNEATAQTKKAWEDFTGGLADAVLDGSKGVKRWWKQMIDDMKRQLVQSGLLKLFGSIFNTGGAQASSGGIGFGQMFGSLFGGGGGGTGGSALGSLFNSGSWAQAGKNLWGGFMSGSAGLAGSGSSLLGTYYGSQFVGPLPAGAQLGFNPGVGTYAAGIGGAYYGYQRAGIGGAVGYGALGLGAAGAIGAGLSGGIGAMAGGATSAFASLGASAAIPVIGWIAAIAAAVDMISGGKLFGTKYRPESSTSTIGISDEGFSADGTLTQVRNRSLFRGRKWETHSIDPGDEARAAAEAFYDGIYDAMVGAARSLAIDVPPMIDAAIRTVTEYDKKGRVKSLKVFTDVLGRTWEEAISDPNDEAEVQAAAQRAASRINSEAIIAVIDAALGTTVQQAIDNFGGGGGGGGGWRGPREGDDFQIVEGGGGLGGAFDVVTATMGEASAIAERWRDDVELLAEGAEFLLLAASDIRAGVGLLGDDGTLTQITDMIEELARGGETLSQTYARVATSTALLDQALAISGVSLDKTREELVRFAVDITDAAGGLEQAKALWDSYFANFYSEAERAAYQREQLNTGAEAAFTAAGLDLSQYIDAGGMEQFREDFEAAMPTLSAEDVANWLRAADALAAVTASARAIDASIADGAWQQYLDGLTDSERAIVETTKYYDDWRDSLIANGATTEQLAAVEDQRAVAMGRLLAAQAEAQAQAEADYQRAVRDIADELAEAGMSDFAIQMRDIGRWTTDTTASLNAAARAAGMQAANEEDLALVHQVAAQRAAAAIAQLRAAAASLVTELFGPAAGSLDDINAQIAALEGLGGQISAGADGAGQAIDNLFDRWLRGVESVQQYLDSMLLGDLSALTPDEQINEARRQLEATQAAALGGDAEALARLPQLSDAYLRLVRGYEASGQDYNDQFDWVRSLLQSVVDLPNPGTAPGAPGGGGGGGVYAPPTSRELEDLYAQRDALLAEQEAEHRMALMEQLGQMVRELIQATGEPLADVAASIGLNLTDLAEGLGINLNDMSATTALALVDMARVLGVDVAELAQNVGVSLGDLGDRQSLLNQALDQTLLSVPEDIRAQLEAPLEAVRNATSEADANAALAQLEDVTDSLPAGIRDLLAPYFDFIDPTPMTTELTRLSDIYDTAAAQLAAAQTANDLLERIASNLSAANAAADIPSYAVGTGYVPRDGLAMIHRGEGIMPAPVNAWLRENGYPVASSASADGGEVVTELRALRAEVAELKQSNARGHERTADAVTTGDRDASIQRAELARQQRDNTNRSNRLG